MKRKTLSIGLAIVSFSLVGASLSAQLSSNSEEITVPLGGIIEILSTGGTKGVLETSWVLTEDKRFIEASRDTVFRTRFSRSGRYTLSAEVTIGSETIQRTFTLLVESRKPDEAGPQPSRPSAVAAFTPADRNSEILLSGNTQMIRVTPIRSDVKVIAIDLNTEVDSNNDGNTQNDDDTRDTLFRSETNPLYVWIADRKSRSMRIGAVFTDSTTAFETIAIRFGRITNTDRPKRTVPTEDERFDEPGKKEILVLKSDNGDLQFALKMPPEKNAKPKLLLWNFGDGQQSMLDRPIHEYAESGTYDVTVEIRDLRSGDVLDSLEETVQVNRLRSETTIPDEDEESNKSGGSLLGMVFKLIFVLILFAGIGAGLFFVVGKIKKKNFSLENTLKKAEKTMVKTPMDPMSDTPPPMEVQAEEVKTEEVSTPPPVEPPAPKPEAAPPPPPAPEPAPATPPTPETTTPTPPSPLPTPAPEPTTPTATSDPKAQTAPDWLGPPSDDPGVPASNVKHSAMEPSAEKLTTDKEQAPSWLQAGIQKADAQGQTPTAPPPPELQAEPPSPTPPPQTPSTAPAIEPTPAPIVEPPQDTAAPSDDPGRDERMKEKKRKKRQRYRENVKNRKNEGETEGSTPETEDSDEPVAYIKAEDIAPMESDTPAPPKDSAETPPHTEEGEKPA